LQQNHIKMMIMTSNILDSYNKQLEENEICYKNNRGKEHDYESINSQQISNNIVEVEYFCLECGYLKYVYNYIEDSEL
jgi:hypothetical protein